MSPRQSRCDPRDALVRFRAAESFLLVAELVLDQPPDEKLSLESVAASLAVLSGIAASDAACCRTLGVRFRGDDHREAIAVVKTVVPHGEQLARDLQRLLGLKDNAHYGILAVARGEAVDAVNWAKRMVRLTRRMME